ncbi:type II toxin-antitoxin system RelE/ParE family toxin [Streptomyces sp. NPDC046887]|uniref:type II toxin-antitoxin system RelE/ParE family toxin n=1 Tax=Streptomyces sp. NPDC046887 TaxID=3155472 RepID=UPI0033DBD894
MTHTIVWEDSALRACRQLKADDPRAGKVVASAVNGLAGNPEPPGCVRVSPNVRRLQVDASKVT